MKCQGCHFAMAQVYCQESQAALCNGCSSVMGEHITRYRLCALCDCNPARIFCRNDNAALCDACDADIHLSNPLALCHDRVALGPLDAEPVKEVQPATKARLERHPSDNSNAETQDAIEVGQVPASSGSTVLFVPKAEQTFKDFDVFDFDSPLFGGDFLEVSGEDWASAPHSPSDGVVPTIETADSGTSSAGSAALSGQDACSADESQALAKTGSFSSPQQQVAVRARGSGSPPAQYMPAMPAIPMAAPFELPTLHIAGATTALDREARVMRYREKRKRRTFEKTIRYQSRKAYAEVRPRIKGRFATKEEVAAMKAAGACFPMMPCA